MFRFTWTAARKRTRPALIDRNGSRSRCGGWRQRRHADLLPGRPHRAALRPTVPPRHRLLAVARALSGILTVVMTVAGPLMPAVTEPRADRGSSTPGDDAVPPSSRR